MIFGREPVAWVGVIAAILIAVIQTLAGEGVISDVASGKALELVNSGASVLLVLVPIIANVLLARPRTTPVAAPALAQGTTVTVVTPGNAPNTQTTLL